MSQNIYLPHADSQASFCDLSYFDYGLHEKTWRKIVDQHPFNHKVSMFLPFCSLDTVKKQFSQQQPFYYNVTLSLVDLLDPAFYERYIKSTANGRLLLHTTRNRLDSDTVIVLNLEGRLIFSMDKSTYESFGIVGKAQRDMDRKKSRYVVEIDLAETGPGTKMYDRLKWCFENTLTEQYEMVATFVNQGSTKEITWAENVVARKQVMEMELEEIGPIDIPHWTANLEKDLAKDTMDAQWEQDALQAMEWIGLAQLDAGRIKTSSKVDPFISTFQPPLPVSHNQCGIKITWTGLIAPCYIMNLLVTLRKLMISGIVQDWASFSVWGYRDSPYTWGNRQHYYRLNGENDYTFLLFPPHVNQQSLISMQMFGSQHIFR